MAAPNPGSPEAVAQGCRCPIRDNEHGRGIPWPDPTKAPGTPVFWISENCPLHGPSVFTQPASGAGEGR